MNCSGGNLMLLRKMTMGSVLFGVLLAGGLLLGEQQPTSRVKGKLPRFWNKLGLSDEQRKKVVSIQAEYKVKIDALRAEISKLEDEQRRDLGKVLTDAQKEELRRIIANQAFQTPTPPKAEAKPKDGKKPGDK
jgi:hypothetical protein